MSIYPKSPLLQLPNTFRAFYGAFVGLHPIQQQAIEPILTNKDLIIQSATGSGKTEAVLAPCLERIIAANRSIAALYIVPTRALAFDIRRRFAVVLKERLGVNFAIRTGDLKSSVGGHADLILTTPESLDVMMGSGNEDLRAFLLRVRTVIIDEVHPFIHQYRGQQLAYLIQRLERRQNERLQKVALSATIADPGAVCKFLNFKSDFILLSENVRRQIQPRLVHLQNDEDELVDLLGDLHREWKYNKILIFANSRGRCDKIFGLLNRQGAFEGTALLHYSNLNVKERQVVEKCFRQQNQAVCVATSTLELGIDVGDVDAVLLFEPPDSVSAFLQRIGRSNRRRNTIHFWGICRGGLAGEQLLRFLALLRLAEVGRVEAVLPKEMPSVLSQQFISCLYEKKRLTQLALGSLFADHPEEEVEALFTALIRQNWLKKSEAAGLFSGGWQYWQALSEYRIWSNFPANEDQYQLVVANESVADIPKSIVRQLEPGDRVLLAGRRLRILCFDEGEVKRVLAEPTGWLDGKELTWLGKGSQVSWEVAQAMRVVLKSEHAEDNQEAFGLFSRSRALICLELEKDRRAVQLDNTIEVVRLHNGSYHYRTFIGAVGNLVMAWSIKEFYAGQEEDISVTADEIGLICSCPVTFEKLVLPLNESELIVWISRHFKMMRAMFPLNNFCAVLPKQFLCRELAGFVRDQRLFDFFQLCLDKTSEIVTGDSANLDQRLAARQNVLPEIPSLSEPLLDLEKSRCSSGADTIYAATACQAKTLTGSIIGEYFRHQQCERWLCLSFLPREDQPSAAPEGRDDYSALRLARGVQFEEKIIAHLSRRHKISHIISPQDVGGRRRSVMERFTETVSWLEQQRGKNVNAGNYIVQPVLSIDSVLPSAETALAGVGIPDLIRLTDGEKEGSCQLMVGDIKSSIQPRYYQKWQVAFYAYLLQLLVDGKKSLSHLSVAEYGFLLTPADDAYDVDGAELAQRHLFNLKPYFASIRAVLRNLNSSSGISPLAAFWQLRKHCVSCPFFDFCYQQALAEEDVQFIPRLGQGTLLKLRDAGVTSVAQEADFKDFFGGGQKKVLGAIEALRHNKILIGVDSGGQNRTDLFPVGAGVFVVHLTVEPVSGLPAGIGLASIAAGDSELQIESWTVTKGCDRRKVWGNFSRRFAPLWEGCDANNQSPHIIFFGSSVRHVMLSWARQMNDKLMTGLFSAGGNCCHYTDLQQVLNRHFSLPLPGTLTLFGLNKILALMPETDLPAPDSLFHDDRFAEIDIAVTCRLILKLWDWLNSHLRSRWHKDKHLQPRQQVIDLLAACRKFIEAERRHKERDIAALMELSLTERVERFRAMGPLQFTDTILDEEGKFLYLFTRESSDEFVDEKSHFGTAKFREGDFLKLVPLGVLDLQSGIPIIVADINLQTGRVALYSRQAAMNISKDILYSLEEDGDDYHSEKLLDAAQKAFAGNNQQITELFYGTMTWPLDFDEQWLQGWLASEGAAAHLNQSQQEALKLPFKYSLGLISGPPGTGKTSLLGWILIALVRQAQSSGTSLRIAVSALTHQGIDQVLNKVVSLVNEHNLADFPARCFKWGLWQGECEQENRKMQVEPCRDAGEILECPFSIVGGTGYGFYDLLHKRPNNFKRKPFDWVIFDEASQIVMSHALLALIAGKGNFLFLGDVMQLPPIIRSTIIKDETAAEGDSPADESHCSVLEILQKRYPHQCRQLNITYRMNHEICYFPGKTWYDGLLHPSPANAEKKLILLGQPQRDFIGRIIDPSKPVVLVEVEHHGCSQESAVEAEMLANIAGRLLLDHGIDRQQLAIISPHRAQNNAIAAHLANILGSDDPLPLIDTVERMQGAERDVVLFGFTCSDPEHSFSEFLNNPNRFNVVLTRARHKVIVVGSKIFFESVAQTEKQLKNNTCFKEFLEYCRDTGCWFT